MASRAAKTGVRALALAPLFQLDEHGRLPGEVALARIAPWVMFGALAIICAIFGYAGLTLWDIWQRGTNDWSSLWDALNFSNFYFLALAASIGSFTLPGANLRPDFLALRRAAVAGDEQLAPLAQQQPAPYPGYEQPIGPTQLAPVPYINQRALVRAQRVGLILGLIFGPLFIAFAGLILWLFLSFSIPSSGNDLPDLLLAYLPVALSGLCGVFGLALLLWALVSWRRAVLLRRGFVVTVDESGLRWKRLPWQRRPYVLPWEQARSFFLLAYRQESDWSQRVIYALDGGTIILTWEALTTANRYEAPSGELTTRRERERAASDRLACVIVERTHLPLRDVTALAEQIVGVGGSGTTSGTTSGDLIGRVKLAALFAGDQETYGLLHDVTRKPTAAASGSEGQRRLAERLEKQLAQRADANGATRSGRTAVQRRWDYSARQDVRFARLLAPFYGAQGRGADHAGFAEPTPLKKRQGAGCIVTLVVLLVWALLASSGWALQRYQTKDYATLPARAQAETPTYASALTGNDGLWLVQEPTKAYPCSYGFTHGAYQISGTADGAFGDAWPTDGVGDSAVAVTVSESGALKSNTTDGIGLLLDGNEADTEFVTFSVYRDGTWDIGYYRYTGAGNDNDYWTTVDSGYSDTIHTASGAANRLLVVSRGPLRLFYVNGQLMTAYNDTNDYLPHMGVAGVYLNNCGMTGRFSNFAIYPAPPQPSPFNLSSWM